ncbi:MAG: HPr family phosphocarrier protein [Polyangiaceae bacterium]|nr:HPr family phosphocarrier protein [Polyangiaceae bacterium]
MRPMVEQQAEGTFEIINKLGLHARAASRLVQVASRFPCEVMAGREGQEANAKSVMGVLLLCGAQGTRITIRTSGEQASEALKAIGDLIADKFGEGE